MSIRLFHRGARLVLPMPGWRGDHHERVWLALHRQPVAWDRILRPALALLGIDAEGADGERRSDPASLRWTNGPFWTTIRVRLPPSSVRKAALRSMGLLKAARYADAPASGADRV